MNILVFATYDIQPQEWAEFLEHGTIPPTTGEDANAPRCIPYILVCSRSHDEFETPTGEISSPKVSELRSASYVVLEDFLVGLGERQDLHSDMFLLLDAEWVNNRKVVLVIKDYEWLDSDGEIDEEGDPNELTERIVWKTYRIPLDKMRDAWLCQGVKTGLLHDEWFESARRPDLEAEDAEGRNE